MDQQVMALAANVLILLLPYLHMIANKAVEKLGEDLPENIYKIWQGIKGKFSKNPTDKDALEDLLKHPDDPDFQAAFRAKLRKALESDSQLRDEMTTLVEKEQAIISNRAVQTGIGNISIQGSNNVVNQKIGQIANSITNIGYQPKQIPQHAVSEFVELMKSLPPLKVHVTASILNPETHFLANQLVDLLRRAGWDASGDSLSMYANLPKGLIFLAPELTLSLDILTKFLKAVGFTNYADFDGTRTSLTIVVNGVD